MALPRNVWNQLKNITAESLIKALERDGWTSEFKRDAVRGFYKNGIERRRVVIHYHPGKTYGANLLKDLLDDIGWSVEDLKRLKIVKK